MSKRMYSVNVAHICAGCVEASSPKSALMACLKAGGKDRQFRVLPYADCYRQYPVAEVCLLGGTRESVTFYSLLFD